MFSRRSLHSYASSLQLFILIINLFFYGHHIAGARIFIYGSCSQDHYSSTNSLFQTNLNSFLSSVATSASQSIYTGFAIGNASETSSSPEDDAVYGLYQCRGDLRIADCSRCVRSVVTQIGSFCPASYGAALQLEGCYVRYERVNFLGKLDTSLKYKRCSRNGDDDDVEFFRRRDDVLADLETAVGFKVSRSGLVEGFAQCLGDLNSSDCALCLAEAVGELKNLCGSAAAADVFLAQCYARYWASGYYEDSGSSHQDHFGRTIAVIVGSLAGLAVLVVLLSVCRTTGSKK